MKRAISVKDLILHRPEAWESERQTEPVQPEPVHPAPDPQVFTPKIDRLDKRIGRLKRAGRAMWVVAAVSLGVWWLSDSNGEPDNPVELASLSVGLMNTGGAILTSAVLGITYDSRRVLVCKQESASRPDGQAT